VKAGSGRPAAEKPSPAPRYAVWMGALVTGLGSEGAPCWLTRLSRESMRLTVAKPAKVSTQRLKAGRTIVVHLSHRFGKSWQIIPVRAKIVRARGNSFGVRIVSEELSDIDELLSDLVEQGRAKPIIARVETAPEPVAGFADPLAISFPTAHSAADLRQVAGDFAGILKQHGGEWIGYLLNRIGTMLIAEVGKTKAEDARRHLDETYLGFMMVRETLATESMRQWMRVVDDLFATQGGHVSDAPNLLVAQSLEMMGTLDLRESLAFNSAVDTLVDCIPPQTMVQVEMRLSDLLDANIDGHNDPIRPDKLGTLVAGVIFQYWDTATSARPIINDALKQSATLLLPLYEAWNAALEQVV
jgi:hypothetical protein